QISAQPTFQDTALSSTAATVRESAPAKNPTPAPSRSTRPERRMSPAAVPSDVHPSTPAPTPVPAAAPAVKPSREIGAGTAIVMTSGGRVCTETNRPGDK